MHNQIQVQSLKNYTLELLKEELKINFPDYNIFSNVNMAYLDLVEKILSVVNKIAPFRDLRIKSNTQDWFDGEVTEAIKSREKPLKHFKSAKLHIDEELYALNSLGLPCKKDSISNICLKKGGKISFDDKTNANTFKEFFC